MHKSFPFQCIFSASLSTFRKGVHCTKALHPPTHAVQCAVRFSTLLDHFNALHRPRRSDAQTRAFLSKGRPRHEVARAGVQRRHRPGPQHVRGTELDPLAGVQGDAAVAALDPRRPPVHGGIRDAVRGGFRLPDDPGRGAHGPGVQAPRDVRVLVEVVGGRGLAWVQAIGDRGMCGRGGGGCIGREGASEAAPAAVTQAVGGGCQKRLGAVTVGYKCHRRWHFASGRQWLGVGWAPWRGVALNLDLRRVCLPGSYLIPRCNDVYEGDV